MLLLKVFIIFGSIWGLNCQISYSYEEKFVVNDRFENSASFNLKPDHYKLTITEPKLFSEKNLFPLPEVDRIKPINQEDWQFKALLSINERSACLNSFEPNNSQIKSIFTRYEFAFLLKECLQNLEEKIQVKLSEEDIIVLEKLQEHFAEELVNLETKIDNLDARLSYLEDHQFSPTTKLFNLVRINYNSYFSGEGDTSTNLQYSHFMVWNTSFTGKDSLFLGFSTTRTPLPNLATINNGIDVGSTREGTILTAGAGNTDGSTFLTNVKYSFPVGDRLYFTIRGFEFFSRAETFLPNFLPYYNVGDGPVSTFAQMPSIYRLGSGSGINVNYQLTDDLVADFAYYASSGNNPQEGRGLFNGNYIAVGRLAYNPDRNFYIEGVYLNGYFAQGSFSYDNGLDFNQGFIGTALANRFDEAGVLFDKDANVSTNSYMLLSYYAITPKFLIGASVNKTDARLIGMGDADIWSYWFAMTFPDLLVENNLGGLIVGVEPTLTGLDSNLPHQKFKRDTGVHIETYYRHQVNDNISITPALIWIISPNQDSQNQDIFMGVVRTSFKF